MATIAPGLNFRIGADVKGINKAIKEAEKSLRGAVSSFSSIGNSLSLALSAPLAAFGAMSVKAAGDIESLRFALEGTMKDAGRSVDEARQEMEALRKAAMAPGLDFAQAVKGSVRLQSVGKSAEEARQIIVQLANALALSGGTADQLDGVTRQFAQMIGKGKILQEDLSIILENMPALAKVMKDTFGTTNAEMMRDMGVTVEDFIAKLTTGMEKLPRAQGGIANAIVNAQNAITQALASVGEELNKTFNISGKLDDFAKWISETAAAFQNLDDGTKRLIGGFVVFAATLGPAFKLMQGGVWIVGQLNLAFLSMQKALSQSLAGQAIPALIAKWRAMDVVMKASVIGATIAVVLALGAAFLATSKDMSAAAQAARSVEEVNRKAAESVAEEKVKVELLTATLKSNTATLDEKKSALKELQAINPKYFGALDAEKSKVTEIDRALNAYVASIMRAARSKAAFDRLVEIEKQLQNLGKEADPTFWQEAWNTISSGGNAFIAAAKNAKTLGENAAELKTNLEAERTALLGVVEANKELEPATVKTTAATAAGAKAAKDAKNDLDLYLESVKKNEEAQRKWNEAREKMGIAPLEALPQKEAPAVASDGLSVGSIMQGFEGMDKAVENVKTVGAAVVEAMTPAQAAIEALTNKVLTFQEVFQLTAQSVTEGGSVMANVAMSMAGAMMQSAEQGATSLKDLAKAALGAAAKVIRSIIMEGVAQAAMSALKGVPFPFNIAAAAAAGAGAGALFNGLINKIGIPALAEGGVLTGPQLVMAGEYPGAVNNPEIVAPENKLRDVFSEVLRASGDMGGSELTCRLEGDTLVFAVERAYAKMGRKR